MLFLNETFQLESLSPDLGNNSEERGQHFAANASSKVEKEAKRYGL